MITGPRREPWHTRLVARLQPSLEVAPDLLAPEVKVNRGVGESATDPMEAIRADHAQVANFQREKVLGLEYPECLLADLTTRLEESRLVVMLGSYDEADELIGGDENISVDSVS